MQTLFINIKELLQVRETGIDKISGSDMAILPKIDNAYLLIENNIISDFGPMEKCPKLSDAKIIDAFIMKCSVGFVAIGRKVALIQNANVRFYAVFMLAGMTCIFVYLYLKLGL